MMIHEKYLCFINGGEPTRTKKSNNRYISDLEQMKWISKKNTTPTFGGDSSYTKFIIFVIREQSP